MIGFNNSVSVVSYMWYPSGSNAPHWCLGSPNLIHVSHERTCQWTSIWYIVELVNDPVDRIIINTATFSVHDIAKHLKDNGAFCNARNLLYGIHCPCLPDIPHAHKFFGLRLHHPAHEPKQQIMSWDEEHCRTQWITYRMRWDYKVKGVEHPKKWLP